MNATDALPSAGQVVRIRRANVRRNSYITVQLTADPVTVPSMPGWAVLTGYRIYGDGHMSDRTLSYPTQVENILRTRRYYY